MCTDLTQINKKLIFLKISDFWIGLILKNNTLIFQSALKSNFFAVSDQIKNKLFYLNHLLLVRANNSSLIILGWESFLCVYTQLV